MKDDTNASTNTNIQTLDRLVDALEQGETNRISSNSSSTSQDPLCRLTDSLQSAFMAFGVFDSMSLTKCQKLAKDVILSDVDDDVVGAGYDWREDATSVSVKTGMSTSTAQSAVPTKFSIGRPDLLRGRSGKRRGQDSVFAVPTKSGGDEESGLQKPNNGVPRAA
mmetsp:Transcript_11605/g.25572  ORF Transcript_11605/g.25572 Transcript_11605/m.25572 type:complete len:165 (-) Transcript_11605:185-679(-)